MDRVILKKLFLGASGWLSLLGGRLSVLREGRDLRVVGSSPQLGSKLIAESACPSPSPSPSSLFLSLS